MINLHHSCRLSRGYLKEELREDQFEFKDHGGQLSFEAVLKDLDFSPDLFAPLLPPESGLSIYQVTVRRVCISCRPLSLVRPSLSTGNLPDVTPAAAEIESIEIWIRPSSLPAGERSASLTDSLYQFKSRLQKESASINEEDFPDSDVVSEEPATATSREMMVKILEDRLAQIRLTVSDIKVHIVASPGDRLPGPHSIGPNLGGKGDVSLADLTLKIPIVVCNNNSRVYSEQKADVEPGCFVSKMFSLPGGVSVTAANQKEPVASLDPASSEIAANQILFTSHEAVDAGAVELVAVLQNIHLSLQPETWRRISEILQANAALRAAHRQYPTDSAPSSPHPPPPASCSAPQPSYSVLQPPARPSGPDSAAQAAADGSWAQPAGQGWNSCCLTAHRNLLFLPSSFAAGSGFAGIVCVCWGGREVVSLVRKLLAVGCFFLGRVRARVFCGAVCY